MSASNEHNSPGTKITKQYSENSQSTMNKLDDLDRKFSLMAQRVANIDKIIDPSNIESIIRAKNELAQIIGDLEKLQTTGVDTVSTFSLNTGKSDATQHRKMLNSEIDQLLQQTCGLFDQLSRLIEARRSLEQASAAVSRSSEPATIRDEPPLTREESSKLLLLVSKAFAAGYCTIEQKNFVKDEICQRKGYLRSIISSADLKDSIVALAQIKPR